jgi:3-deoxy-7-phosphoheptulonate synthase
MVIVMAPGATDAQIDAVITRVTTAGGEAFVSRGDTRTIVGLVGDVDKFHGLNLRTLPGVAEVVRISTPFKLVSRQHHPYVDRPRRRARVPIGPDTFLIAGPCAVETPNPRGRPDGQGAGIPRRRVQAALLAVRLQGSASKPADRRRPGETGLPVVTEVSCGRRRPRRRGHAPGGYAQLQNFTLLQAVGEAGSR